MYRHTRLFASTPVLVALTPLLVVLLAFGLLAGCGGSGSEPFGVSGTSVRIDSTQEGDPVVEGNTVTITGVDHSQLSGDLEGTNETKIVMVMDTTTGAFTLEYDVTFTGNMGDKEGTLTSHGEGTGQMLSADSSTWTVSETVIGGTGDFKGLTGTTEVEGKGGPEGSSASFTGTWQYK
jgi:hypothetical protein